MRYAISLLLLISFISVSPAPVMGATLIGSYGFEDWDGDADTTPGYPFGADYQEYWQDVYTDSHQGTTEVITTYAANTGGTWTAHTGTYFLMASDAPDYAIDPAISGILEGRINQQGRNIGENWTYGGLDRASWDFSTIATGEFYVSFWIRFNKGYYNSSGGGRVKLIVVNLTLSGGGNTTVFMHLTTTNGVTPDMHLWAEGDSVTSSGLQATNAYDGSWHNIKMYINTNTGTLRGWYDEDSPTSGNALVSWTAPDGSIDDGSSADGFENMHIQGNWSASTPNEQAYHALDDIEIWDGMSSTTVTCYPDVDGDLYPGTGSESVEICSANYYETAHFTAMTTDCDDTDILISPGATDICGNSIAEDCVADVACPPGETCEDAIGYCTNATDCNTYWSYPYYYDGECQMVEEVVTGSAAGGSSFSTGGVSYSVPKTGLIYTR